MSALMLLGGISVAPAYSADATILGVALTGTSGDTASVGGTLYAKAGAKVTVTVTTTPDTRCVAVAGAVTGQQTAPTGKATWTFTSSTLTGGDGVQGLTIAASRGVGGGCGGGESAQASFVLDNTGPVVAGALTPAPNAAGWNKANATVNWTASDSGVGVAAAQPFQTDSVTTDGIVTKIAPAQTDRLGNVGAPGSLTVRVDKTAPTITATQTTAGFGQPTTVTFTCADATSGVGSCLADGSTTNAKTVTQNGIVTGTATDVAGNTATASVEVKNVDTTAPVLSGSPAGAPDANGWYRGDVTVHWTATDPESGIPTPPTDTTISGEGTGLTSTTSVENGAGLSTTATSSPAVKIDRTPPVTSMTGAPNAWTNQSVTLELVTSDNLSGVASTTYSVDGGPEQQGSSVTLTTEGEHAIRFFSTDNAGNVETAKSVDVRIDKTAPIIDHRFTAPDAYQDGDWTNQNVTVTFDCQDQGGSGLASCTDPVTVDMEGAARPVDGSATDNAGNSSSHTAFVNIDKTAPAITATVDRAPNADGWYDHDVTVTFTASDGLSGIASTTANQVLGEGRNKSAVGTATDNAGNSAQAAVEGINVDKTAPRLTGTAPAGWQTGDVTVTWECADELSGPNGTPDDSLVEGEGENLSVSASCTDKAGNATTETVTGIQIDRTAPTTLAEVPEPGPSGWYGAPVEVTLNVPEELSGVENTYYRVDGGTAQTYDGPFTFGEEGTHTIEFWSEDVAGNLEEAGAPITLKVDRTVPTTTLIDPESPDNGWHVVSGIPFAFSADDGTDRSGVAATYYTIDGEQHTYGERFTENLSTGVHTVTYWSVDNAGNAESPQQHVIQVDTIAPTIRGVATPGPNDFGWNNTDVAVTFTCEDVGSGVQTGVAGCAGDMVLANDGADQSVRGNAVDVAGNTSSIEVKGINIDKTKPTLVGVPSASSGADWYSDDVVVTWVGDDGLSQIDPDTQPSDSTVTGEGRGLSAGPVTIRDKAGNVSEPATVTGIKIDRTAPRITGGPTTPPNGAGWHRGDVTVAFDCSDPELADGSEGSGVANCPDDQVVSGNGAGQQVTSEPARDVAGNLAPGHTVDGINIDGLAPSSSSNNTCTAVNEWCKGDVADVLLTATDQAGLSGVKEIHYVVDDGAEQVADGDRVTVSVPLSGSGAGTIRYWAVDRAGNAESPNAVALKWDNIAPTVSHSLTPRPNAAGWNNADVRVEFTAKDDDKGSGVAGVTAPVTVSEETAGEVVRGTATDRAGNIGADSVTVKLDKTDPTITGAVTAGTLTPSGWYSGPVTVAFECADELSGVTVCPDATTLTANGEVSAAGTAYDAAGNTADATVGGIRIDQEKPALTTADVNVAGKQYLLGDVPAATCTATDAYSGLESCRVTVAGGRPNGVGEFTYTATAVDKAGNTTTVTGTYRVIYRFDGYLQPINDTAHQVGVSTSVFKAGSTVPVKFQLKRADGTVVQATTAPVWMAPVKGSSMSAPVDESVYTAPADGGSAYRYDATAKQYIFNWKTPSGGGNYYRIGVVLDDGQAYSVNIGLR